MDRQTRYGLHETAIALSLVEQAQWHHVQRHRGGLFWRRQGFGKAPLDRRLPHVLARRGAVGRGWHRSWTIRLPMWRSLPLRAWRSHPPLPDGHTERQGRRAYAVRLWPGRLVRAVCATTDRRVLPDLSTWYLTTNLPAPLTEIVRICRLAQLSSKATNR
jgi:hypothetical protein